MAQFIFNLSLSRFFQNNIIKISNLRILNFRLIEELTINFSKETTIILGKNGFGKTSILQALSLSILPDETKELKPIDFEPYIRIGREKSNFKLFWQGNILIRNTEFTFTHKKSSNKIAQH